MLIVRKVIDDLRSAEFWEKIDMYGEIDHDDTPFQAADLLEAQEVELVKLRKTLEEKGK